MKTAPYRKPNFQSNLVALRLRWKFGGKKML